MVVKQENMEGNIEKKIQKVVGQIIMKDNKMTKI